MIPQPLLIFRKDTRHLWPEILIVLVLFVAFAASAPSGWTGSEYAGYLTILATLLKVLMPVAWLVIISRLIHDESLVGDRQFWTSRPYHWGLLLAAKILFLLAYIYLPFFLMQVYLLKHAGLHPLTVLPALGHNLLLLTAVLIVPIVAIATVTSTFPRLLLSVLGAILYILVLLGVVGYLTFLHMQVPHLDWILNGIFILVPLIVVALQYRTRKTELSRILLIATPLVAAVILLAVPTSALISHAYPALSASAAPKMGALSDRYKPNPVGRLLVRRNMVAVSLPYSIAGIDEQTDYIVQGVRAHISGAGVEYTSPYLTPIQPPQLNGGTPATLLSFSMPVELFNKVRTTPVDLHLDLAAEHLNADKPSTWKATAEPFSVPGKGLCSFPEDGDPTGVPTCRYPLTQPEISFVTAPLSAGSCSAGGQKIPARGSIGGKGSALDFDPVITVPMTLRTGDPDPQHTYVLCPGTDLSFIEATQQANASLSVEQKGVVLDPFAARIPPPAAQGGNPRLQQ